MSWFYNLKIRLKLLISFGIVILLTGILGIVAIVNMGELNDNDTFLYEKTTLPLGQLGRIVSAFQRIRVNVYDIITLQNPAELDDLHKRIDAQQEEIRKNLKSYELTFIDKQDAEDHKVLTEQFMTFYAQVDKIIESCKGNKTQEAILFMKGEMNKTRTELQKQLEKMVLNNENTAKLTSDKNTSFFQSTRTIMISIVIICVVLALGLGIFISRIVSRPIEQVSASLEDICNYDLNNLAVGAEQFANGNLDVKFELKAEKLDIHTTDETGNLAGTLNTMIDKIHGGISSVENVTKTVNQVTEEINSLVSAAKQGKLSQRGNPEKYQGGFKDIIIGLNQTLDAVIGPLNVAAEYVDRISKGDIPNKITEQYNGDFNELKNNLNTCIEAVTALIVDANMLSKSAVEGKLSTRADAAKHQGDFRKIVQGVNDTLDAVIGPLNVAAEYVDRISKGDIPGKITENYNGDFNELKNNLNTCIDAVNGLIADADMLSHSAVEGKLATRAKAEKHFGDFRKIIEGVNGTLDAVIGPLNVAAEYVDRISKGDIPAKITDNYNGDFNEIKNNLNTCIDAVNSLIADANMLSRSAVEGKLSARAEIVKHQGDFRKIVEGVNGTLDAVIGPLSVAAKYVEKISKGDIPNKITENYNGDFNEIKNNLNMCIDAVNALIADANMLSLAAVEGKLATRADAAKHQGDFRKIIEGVNGTLDAVIGPLNVAAKYVDMISKGNLPAKITDNYNGDFNEIKNNLNTCIDAVNLLVVDAQQLATAAVDGKLSTRAEAFRHQGDFRKIVEGVNHTLDAVITPIKEGVVILEKMGQGDMTVRITSDYKGDHQLIKDSINSVAQSLNSALGEVSEAVAATASASNQISSSTEEMAAGSQEQTQQTTEVAGGVEEMTRTILENTKNVSRAADTAKDAGRKAKEGGMVVKETIDGMNKIADVVKKSAETVQALGKSSDQIGEIVQVIDDIADQTNLLALNAAIEAARAGEQGRGFAVVADEVRKLAERTTKATKEIATMIRQIQKDTINAVQSMEEGTSEVEKGKSLANKAGLALEEIVEGSQQVLDIVSQVAAASEEQSTAAEEISRSIEAISSVSQETAAGTQQIAHAAEDLNRLTLNLENLISQFKVDARIKHHENTGHAAQKTLHYAKRPGLHA